jgi:succinate dehydrogenase / fumarate reductase cytochrome b subunit
MTDLRRADFVARDSAGALIRRPLSPHIGIYRWQITMISSILNRAAGIALSIGSLMLVCWLVAAAAGPARFALIQEFLISPLGLLLLLGWTAALFYHLFAGIRHLAWDMGYGFAHKSLNWVSWLVLGLTAASTVAVWVVGYARLGG